MTVQELAAQYRSKIIARRWLATMIDMVVLFFGIGLIAAPLPHESTTASILLIFGVPFVYYVVFEVLSGRSVGKLATGLVVIDQMGAKPSISTCCGRFIHDL